MWRNSLESGCRCQNFQNATIWPSRFFRRPLRLAWLIRTVNVPGSIPDAARSAARSSGGANRSVGIPCGM